ncbi:MAG: rod shape-determining protein [Bacilli bacterium]|nr:rod shape-determining protein [Bacilli bacterium]
MLSKDIGIDLGTANVLIYVKGQGIVLNEPSVVAIQKDTKNVLAVGEEAYEMLGRTPGKVLSIRPLKDGVIADFELTQLMLNAFIKKIKAKGVITKPRILICCPSNITGVERNAIKEAAEGAGARQVFVEEEPKVAAIGAGLDISKPSASMVIDIGGGTTDIAILSLGEIVTSKSIRVAGDNFNQEIMNYIKEKYKLLIGERTAEDIKLKIGTVYNTSKKDQMKIKGRDLVTGLPNSITLTSKEIEESLRDSISKIVIATKQVLEDTLPELSADIVENGIVITGGGALLDGIDLLLKEKLKVPVTIAEDPLTCVVEGTSIMLDNIKLLKNN